MSEADAPVVVGVAPNGARRTAADHPAIPVRAEELAQTAAACADAGASFIHLHVRDDAGRHTLDADAYRRAIAAIRRERSAGDLAVQITTESGGRYGPDAQRALVRELAPEAVSLSVRELVPSAAEEPASAALFAWIHHRDIAPQYILYSPHEVGRFEDLLARGVIPDRGYWVLFVLGRRGGNAEPAELLPFLAARRTDYPWAVCAFGRREAACALTAAGLGGHARVGFENNLALAGGRRAPDNAALVAQLAAGAALLGRPLARGTAIPGDGAGRAAPPVAGARGEG